MSFNQAADVPRFFRIRHPAKLRTGEGLCSPLHSLRISPIQEMCLSPGQPSARLKTNYGGLRRASAPRCRLKSQDKVTVYAPKSFGNSTFSCPVLLQEILSECLFPQRSWYRFLRPPPPALCSSQRWPCASSSAPSSPCQTLPKPSNMKDVRHRLRKEPRRVT